MSWDGLEQSSDWYDTVGARSMRDRIAQPRRAADAGGGDVLTEIAEQLRIRNLIALANLPIETPEMLSEELRTQALMALGEHETVTEQGFDGLPTVNEYPRIRPEIAAILGIGGDS